MAWMYNVPMFILPWCLVLFNDAKENNVKNDYLTLWRLVFEYCVRINSTSVTCSRRIMFLLICFVVWLEMLTA